MQCGNRSSTSDHAGKVATKGKIINNSNGDISNSMHNV